MADEQDPYAGMAEDSAAPDQSGDEEMPESPEDEAEAPKDEEGGNHSALVPKAIFAGKELEPGTEITMRIKHLYDDEVELECVRDEYGNKPKRSSMEQSTDQIGAEMGA